MRRREGGCWKKESVQEGKEKRRQIPQGDTVACLTLQKQQLWMSRKTLQVWKRSALPPKMWLYRLWGKTETIAQIHKTWGPGWPGWWNRNKSGAVNLARQVCFNTLKEELTNRNGPHDRERGWRKRPFSALKHRNRVWLQPFPFMCCFWQLLFSPHEMWRLSMYQLYIPAFMHKETAGSHSNRAFNS